MLSVLGVRSSFITLSLNISRHNTSWQVVTAQSRSGEAKGKRPGSRGQRLSSVPEDVKFGRVTLTVIVQYFLHKCADALCIYRGERNGPKFLDLELPALWNVPLFSSTLTFKKLLQYLSHRMFAARAWSIKCRRKEKLIAQFGGKLRDERFEPN